jgi:superfamily II DNA or RNA helicase
MPVQLTFDRGTLRLDGSLDGVELDPVRYDDRAGFHRAPAYCYATIREALARAAIPMHDEIARAAFNPPLGVSPPSLRPYQAQALSAFDTFGRRGVIALPTGAGKTRVACAAIAAGACSAVVLVPTRALLDQWASVLRPIFGEPIGVVGDGVKQVEPITVMTFESAYRCLDRFGHRFGMLVVDEAHHFAGGMRAEALEMCTAPLRLGLTATPPSPGSPGADRLRELLGPVVFELQIADLAGEHLAALDMITLHVALTAAERDAYDRDMHRYLALRREILRINPDADWVTCLKAIARVPGGGAVLSAMYRAAGLAAFPAAKRTAIRELLARHRDDRVLLFTANTDDAYAIARESLIPVITAEVARKEREEILAAFRDRSVRAICSAQVLNEGIDVPDANVAILVGGALGAREHVQRIGRILRPREGKRAIAYELVTMETVDEARTRAKRRRLAARSPALHRQP